MGQAPMGMVLKIPIKSSQFLERTGRVQVMVTNSVLVLVKDLVEVRVLDLVKILVMEEVEVIDKNKKWWDIFISSTTKGRVL
jgi:hypothetical protein